MICGDRSLRSSHGPQRVTPPAERRIICARTSQAPASRGAIWRWWRRRAPPTPTCWPVPPRARTSTRAVLLAEYQTAGRGRHGRSWSTPPRSQIALSVGVGVGAVPNEAWGWLPLLTGVAVVDALDEVTGAGGRPEMAQQCAPGQRKGPASSPKWPHPNRWSWWVSA